MFVVPTISCRPSYGHLVLRHSRRELLWLSVTTHPTAWIPRQLTEACGWSEPPRYIIRDRDSAYGEAFMGVSEPWAYGIAQSQLDRLGKMGMLEGSSDRSGESALITSLSSVNDIFAIC
jgi:hypothetical protein